MLGQGLSAIETETKETTKKLAPYSNFASRSGSARGLHALFRTDATKNGVLLDPKTDKNLLARLTKPEEINGVLNWAIDGLRRLLTKQRFTRAKTVEETRHQYVQVSNPIKAFAEECIEVAPNSTIPKDEIYDAYTTYCRKHSLPTTSKNVFSMRLPEYCPAAPSKTRRLGKTVRAWLGIQLTSGEVYEVYAPIPIEENKKKF